MDSPRSSSTSRSSRTRSRPEDAEEFEQAQAIVPEFFEGGIAVSAGVSAGDQIYIDYSTPLFEGQPEAGASPLLGSRTRRLARRRRDRGHRRVRPARSSTSSSAPRRRAPTSTTSPRRASRTPSRTETGVSLDDAARRHRRRQPVGTRRPSRRPRGRGRDRDLRSRDRCRADRGDRGGGSRGGRREARPAGRRLRRRLLGARGQRPSTACTDRARRQTATCTSVERRAECIPDEVGAARRPALREHRARRRRDPLRLLPRRGGGAGVRPRLRRRLRATPRRTPQARRRSATTSSTSA